MKPPFGYDVFDKRSKYPFGEAAFCSQARTLTRNKSTVIHLLRRPMINLKVFEHRGRCVMCTSIVLYYLHTTSSSYIDLDLGERVLVETVTLVRSLLC
jgi:hypothetical protein